MSGTPLVGRVLREWGFPGAVPFTRMLGWSLAAAPVLGESLPWTRSRAVRRTSE